MSVPASSIGLPTSGAKVTSAQVVPAAGSGASAVGEYCKVLFSIAPADPTAPSIIPGLGHVFGSPRAQGGGFTAAWDPLAALEAWVEDGQPPANLVATDANAATAGRTRPVCEYPGWPRYDGVGDVNAAASFSCVTP